MAQALPHLIGFVLPPLVVLGGWSGGLDRGFGAALLATVWYMHFAIEHVYGHHRHVGTPRDPATARLGEASHHFLARSATERLRSAWEIEPTRLAKRGRGHVAASKRYQVLHTLEAAPQLPAGYSAMLLLALCPPLWRRVMDPRVDAWRHERSR